MSEVVTGDAVVVEVRVAQMPTRALALLIDVAVQLTALIGGLLALQAFSVISDSALFAAVAIVLTVLALVGYPVIFESITRGRSLGKLALGLRVVSDDGSPERFRQALFRGLAGVVEIWAFSGAPALISSLVSARGKRLGDIFAGTIVISERGPRESGRSFWMPPQLAAWAANLELSQLPEDVAQAARQYLLRWHELSPQVQHEMGVRIAAQVSASVSPAPPPGVPPHAYLSAVLAERRRRDEARLARQAAAPGRPAYAQPGPHTVPGPYGVPGPYNQPGPYNRPGPSGQPGPYNRPGPSGQPGPSFAPPGSPQEAPAPGQPPAPEPPQSTPGGFAPPA